MNSPPHILCIAISCVYDILIYVLKSDIIIAGTEHCKGGKSVNANDIAMRLDRVLDSHRKELEFIGYGDRPLTKDEIVQLARTSYYTMSEFRDVLVELAKSIR